MMAFQSGPNTQPQPLLNYPGYPTMQNTAQGPIQYQVVYMKEPPRSLEHYPSKHARVLGIIQIVCGLVAIALGIGSIFAMSLLYFVGHGIWGGVCPIIAGAFGIASAQRKSKGLIVVNLVMSTIAACLVVAPFIVATISAGIDGDNPQYRSYGNDGIYDQYNTYPYDTYPYDTYPHGPYDHHHSSYYGGYYIYNNAKVGIESTIAIVMVIECIVAIWAAAIACNFTCCCRCCEDCCCFCYNKKNSQRTAPYSASMVHPLMATVGNGIQYVHVPNVGYYGASQQTWTGYPAPTMNVSIPPRNTDEDTKSTISNPPSYTTQDEAGPKVHGPTPPYVEKV